jgi:UDP-N-acetyl-D-glucosamine dehydrogenase
MRDENTSPDLEQLLAKLQDRSAVIGIVGLGYRVLK